MLNPNDFYVANPSEFVIETISLAYPDKALNKHTMVADQKTGKIAEYVFDKWCEYNWLTVRFKANDKGPVDFIIGDGKTFSIDVKAKRRTQKVNLSYCDCHVEERQLAAECNIYVFASYCEAENCCQLIGWIDKKTFMQVARVYEAGEKDPDNFVNHADSRVIKGHELRPMAQLAKGVANMNRSAVG